MTAPFDGFNFERQNVPRRSEEELNEIEAALNQVDEPLNLEKPTELADALEAKLKLNKPVTDEEQGLILDQIVALEKLQNDAEDIGIDAEDPKLVNVLVRLRKIRDSVVN